MKIHYLKGCLTSEGFTTHRDRWRRLWEDETEQAKTDGVQLIVLAVPDGEDWLRLGGEIEAMLQDKYGLPITLDDLKKQLAAKAANNP